MGYDNSDELDEADADNDVLEGEDEASELDAADHKAMGALARRALGL